MSQIVPIEPKEFYAAMQNSSLNHLSSRVSAAALEMIFGLSSTFNQVMKGFFNIIIPPILTYEDVSKSEDLVQKIHKKYAEELKDKSPGEKALLQAKAIWESAMNDRFSEKTYSTILRYYLPDCPHLNYVTLKNLNFFDHLYHTHQKFYAEWCHLTALAMAEKIKQRIHFDQLLEIGAHSRYLLARICVSDDYSFFGKYRSHCHSSLLTPIAAQYSPWFEMCKKRKFKCIEAVDVDGERYRGTSFNICGKELHWVHGLDLEILHQVSKNWFCLACHWNPIVYSVDEFYHTLGCFYHAMIQYSPFMRGSATFSHILMISLMMSASQKNNQIQIPHAVELLDCYALSMDRDPFLERVFIPLCRGEASDEDLKRLLSD